MLTISRREKAYSIDIISEKRVTWFTGKLCLKSRNLFIEDREELILMFVGGGK